MFIPLTSFFLYTGVTGSTKRLGTVRDFFFFFF